MGDWFQIIEHSEYRRRALLAEASRDRQAALVGGVGMRAQLATALIGVALWLAPATARSRRQAGLHDEPALPGIVGS